MEEFVFILMKFGERNPNTKAFFEFFKIKFNKCQKFTSHVTTTKPLRRRPRITNQPAKFLIENQERSISE